MSNESFLNADSVGKFKMAIDALDFSEACLGKILGLHGAIISDVLSRRVELRSGVGGHLRIINFRSILFRMVRVADYNESALRELWTEKGASVYAESKFPPPWYPIGMEGYLKFYKYPGVVCAARWVRHYN